MAGVKDGIWKRGNNWYISVKVNGRRRVKSFGRDRKAAELALAEILKHRAVANATNDWSGLADFTRPKTRKTFAEVAEDYLAERASLKHGTLRGYREVLKNYLLPAFGKMEVSDITEEDVARFQADVSKNVSAGRTNNIMGLLRYIMKVCLRRKLIAENPTVGVRQLTEKQPDIDPLSKEELDLALSKIVSHYGPLFTCLAWTGARPDELCALRWKDIDFKRNEIRINKGRVRGSEDIPKTASSSRIVPMLSVVRIALEQAKQQSAANLDGYVFTTKNGQPIDKHLDHVWRTALRKAGLRHRPSYQLRHTFASLCLENGVTPGWLAMVLGHSTLQTTFKHYARYIKDNKKENESRLKSMLSRTKERSTVEKF
ncbi:MAG: site-specific integrase [Candidatus Obscuribacterales bacterium]|nr:site-specific integrase [Candidatus Obscuribacterales bacterium]